MLSGQLCCDASFQTSRPTAPPCCLLCAGMWVWSCTRMPPSRPVSPCLETLRMMRCCRRQLHLRQAQTPRLQQQAHHKSSSSSRGSQGSSKGSSSGAALPSWLGRHK